MQFHRYHRLAGAIARRFGQVTSDTDVRARLLADPLSTWTVRLEDEWRKDRQPYYRIWPGILEPLLSLQLERVQTNHIRLPIRSLCLELPVSQSVTCGDRELATVLAHQSKLDGIATLVSWSGPESPFARLYLDLTPSKTIEETIPKLVRQMCEDGSIPEIRRSAILDGLRLLCMVSLMGADPDLVVPRVLEADRAKWDDTHDLGLVYRARRRGNVGWDIGRETESRSATTARGGQSGRTVSPHYRHAHPALVWTGPKRAVPRIVLRRGSFVHGANLERVPTGYHADESPACPYCLKPMVHHGARWACEDCEAATWTPDTAVPITEPPWAGHIRGSRGRVIRDPRGLT